MSKSGRGSEENFNQIVVLLAQNTKSYEEKKIKHYQWSDQVDNIFGSYGWSKTEFYKELNNRLGIVTNDMRREAKEEANQKQKVKSKIKR